MTVSLWRFSTCAHLLPISICTLLMLITPRSAMAADTVNAQIRADGSPVQITLAPEHAYVNTVRLWFVSNGNSTLPMYLGLNGPDAVRISAQHRYMRTGNLAQQLNARTGWMKVDLESGRGKTRVIQTLDNNLDTPLTLRGMIRKDSCIQTERSRYIVAIDLDLRRVKQEVKTAGYQIRLTPLLAAYQGKIAGKIKRGDERGMYAGKWILLAARSGSGTENIRLTEWRKNRIVSTKKISIGRYDILRGIYSSRSVIGGLLKGGKGTFEIISPYASYSMCFALSPKTQEVNWPGPGGY